MWVWSKLSSAQWRDAWEERFHAMADTNLVLTELPGRQRLRVEMYCARRAEAEAIQRQFGGSVRELKARNWAALATPQIEPVKIRDRFVIVSQTAPAELEALRERHPGRELLVIPVEMAFGTGDHPTTATCLRWLCDMDLGGLSVLDAGCGTGILSIAAARLGAGPVLGIDFDPAAVRAARENAVRNGTPAVEFQQQDLLRWKLPRRYDLILANIFADVLTAAFPKLRSGLAPSGRLILSGIMNRHSADCLAAGEAAGFHFEKVTRRGRWVTALAARSR